MLSSTCYQDCTFSSKQQNSTWWIIFLIRLTKINLAKKPIAKMSRFYCESHLLSFDENEKVKRILGDKVISKSTAVAQLYTSNSGEWQHIVTGVACLSKDSSRRSFFIQGD